MENFFLVELFHWGERTQGKWMHRAQALLNRFKVPWVLRRGIDPTRDMTCVEHRVNLWHFAEQVVAYQVPGDFVEFGTFHGETAVIFQKVLDALAPDRRLHLYDHFQMAFHLSGRDIRAELEKNFRAAGAGQPIIHAGDFMATIPSQLPEKIAFAHVDCGFGGDPDAHEATMLRLFEHLYPRMSPGAVCVLMDYHQPGRTPGPDYNPGTGRAARKFFADKPEKVSPIWADEYSQGYFRKQ